MSKEISLWVRREPRAYRKARIHFANFEEPDWDEVSGGLQLRMPMPHIFGYIWCNQLLEGDLNHSCRHGPPPHRIKVCAVKVDNAPEIFDQLLKVVGPRPSIEYEPSQRRIAAAYHEAGHAIVALIKDIPFPYVTPTGKRTNGHLTHCLVERTPDMFYRDMANDPAAETTLLKLIGVALAGHVAEHRFKGAYSRVNSQSDIQAAHELALKMVGNDKELQAFMRWMKIRTELLLDMTWPSVASLAQELAHNRRRYSHDDVRSIMREAGQLDLLT